MENNCFHLNLFLLQVAVKLGHCIISGSTQRQNADESNRSWILIQKRGLFFYMKTLLVTEIWQFYFFILLSLENLSLKNDREADKSGRGKPVKVISCTGLASMPFFSVRVSFLLGLKQEWWRLPFIPDLPPEIAFTLFTLLRASWRWIEKKEKKPTQTPGVHIKPVALFFLMQSLA